MVENDKNPAESMIVRGPVKWFDAVKGYGFIITELGDVLLHKTVLRDAGVQIVFEGTTVTCEVIRRDRGLQAQRIIELDISTAVPPGTQRSDSAAGGEELPKPEGELTEATVKWFNRAKGYGFITQGENTPDIFIHIETLRRFGVGGLLGGQVVQVRIGEGAKGPMVTDIRISEPEEPS